MVNAEGRLYNPIRGSHPTLDPSRCVGPPAVAQLPRLNGGVDMLSQIDAIESLKQRWPACINPSGQASGPLLTV
jgi:hypothetical protein